MGAEGIRDLLQHRHRRFEIGEAAQRPDRTPELKIKKNAKRLKVWKRSKKSGIKPEWMVSKTCCRCCRRTCVRWCRWTVVALRPPT